MDVWIETAAGNIAMAAAVSHILPKSKDDQAYDANHGHWRRLFDLD